MSTDTIQSPSAATLRRQFDSDADGVCRVCRAEPDWKCDEVEHRRARREVTADPVHRPAHYTRGSIEVRDFVADQQLNFNRGSAVKYIVRAGHKDRSKEVEDLEKAISCLQHEVACLKEARARRVAAFKAADNDSRQGGETVAAPGLSPVPEQATESAPSNYSRLAGSNPAPDTDNDANHPWYGPCDGLADGRCSVCRDAATPMTAGGES